MLLFREMLCTYLMDGPMANSKVTMKIQSYQQSVVLMVKSSCGITVSEKCFAVVLGDYFLLVGKDFIK